MSIVACILYFLNQSLLKAISFFAINVYYYITGMLKQFLENGKWQQLVQYTHLHIYRLGTDGTTDMWAKIGTYRSTYIENKIGTALSLLYLCQYYSRYYITFSLMRLMGNLLQLLNKKCLIIGILLDILVSSYRFFYQPICGSKEWVNI